MSNTQAQLSSCPISLSLNDVGLMDLSPIGGGVYLWNSDLDEDKQISVRIRLGRSGAFIEGYAVRFKPKAISKSHNTN